MIYSQYCTNSIASIFPLMYNTIIVTSDSYYNRGEKIMKKKIKELMNRALRKEEGFTLIEIIVVIVIIAILAAIAIPSVLGYINDANEAQYVAEARSVYLAIQVEETIYNASTYSEDGTGYVRADDSNGMLALVKARVDGDNFTLTSIEDLGDGGYHITFNSDIDGVEAVVSPNEDITIE